eukprot:TRINITY_DN9482_c0_g1_i5.p1 TRINITY_DN9482_c0_g1~~TRINITY_DN9482_c0_g1_i5.p1  ORF type:complete len:625 (+),score=82.37 TRINITY_DN9482_c0_g1_i5:197-2071(+)
MVMTEADAIIAKEDGSIELLYLNSYVARKFTSLTKEEMLVPFEQVSHSVVNGSAVLRLTGAAFPNMEKVELQAARQSECAYPCLHDPEIEHRQHFELNLVSGQLEAAVELDGAFWDGLVIALFAYLLLVAAVCAVVVRTCKGNIGRKMLMPTASGWSIGGLLGMAAVWVGVIGCAVVLALNGEAAIGSTASWADATGYATATALLLAVLWSFYKAGIHSALCITRESAWRFHVALGDLFLIAGTIHGVLATNKVGMTTILAEGHFLLGLLAVVVSWLSVIPIFMHIFFPTLVPYKAVKILHFAAVLGHLMALLHMVGNFGDRENARNAIVLFLHVAALLAFIVQKILAKMTMSKNAATIQQATVADEPDGQHLFMTISAPGLKFESGQWVLLSAPSISKVPHPFTIVPGGKYEGSVQIFAKVSGSFTSDLAKACSSGSKPAIGLEGPYGRPADVKGAPTIFVVGGVGVTPVLSLLPYAHDSSQRVGLFWPSRSLALLRNADHLIKAVLDYQPAEFKCVSYTGVGTSDAEDLPLGAARGRQDLNEYLVRVSKTLRNEGYMRANLFLCGPTEMMNAARKAAKQNQTGGFFWEIHQEVFNFLPLPPRMPKTSRTKPVNGQAFGKPGP